MTIPTIEQLTEMYDNFFTADSGKWAFDERNRVAYEAVMTFMPEPMEILDIGCGNGHTLHYFQKRKNKAKLYGMDISGVAVGIAQEKLPDAEFFVTDLLAHTGRKKFEAIIVLGSMQLLLDPDAGLQKIKNLLKKDGIVYVELPDNLSYSKGKHEYRRLRIGSKQYEWHLTREEWEAKFLQAGFVIKKRYANTRPQWRFGWILE